MNLIILQARENSTRLPNKVLLEACGKTLLEHCYDRCCQSKADKVVIATTGNSKKIQQLCIDKQINYFVGSEENLLKRYYDCAKKYKANNIIRITSDNAVIDYKIINQVLKKHLKEDNDFTTNAWLGKETFPEGFEVAILKFDILKWLYYNIKDKIFYEHVVTYIMEYPKIFKVGILNNKKLELKDLRLTVDNELDFKLIKLLYFKLYYKNEFFGYKEIYDLYLENKEMFFINKGYERDYNYYEQKRNLERNKRL